jgi:hypothetical protein
LCPSTCREFTLVNVFCFCRGFAPLHNQSGSLLCAAALHTRIICQLFILYLWSSRHDGRPCTWANGALVFNYIIVIGVIFVFCYPQLVVPDPVVHKAHLSPNPPLKKRGRKSKTAYVVCCPMKCALCCLLAFISIVGFGALRNIYPIPVCRKKLHNPLVAACFCWMFARLDLVTGAVYLHCLPCTIHTHHDAPEPTGPTPRLLQLPAGHRPEPCMSFAPQCIFGNGDATVARHCPCYKL